MFKTYVLKKAKTYVKHYFKTHPDIKLVVVAGSEGKTSAKTAIATVLSQRYRVRLHEDDDRAGINVPLAILGIEYPENSRGVFAWLRVLRAAKKRINDPADVDVIVQELDISRVGDMAKYARYLHPDIAVVTAITPEHMDSFKTIETVAKEELAAANFSKLAIINRDDIDGDFADLLTNPNIDTYGTTASAEYRFEVADFTLEDGYAGVLIAPEFDKPQPAKIKLTGEHSLRPAMAAVSVAAKLGMLPADIAEGLTKVRAVSGRMNVLRGVNNSILIDDTYDSSPAAAKAALQTLYMTDAPQRIAILGSMSDLGATSPAEHTALGEFCDPNLLAWVVTIGDEAENYLAPAARGRGCQVKSFKSALDAGAFVNGVLEKNAVVLAKGSQTSVYGEEALKILLHETHEDSGLVRQSTEWIKRKNDFFASLK